MNKSSALLKVVKDSPDSLVHNETLWQRFLDYNLSQVTEVFKEQVPKHAKIADALELECRRFLYVTTLVQGQKLVPSEAIDQYWHNFILFTAEYHDFCIKTAGKFIHHYPVMMENTGEIFEETQMIVETLFGDFENSDLWSSFEAARSSGKSCCGSGTH